MVVFRERAGVAVAVVGILLAALCSRSAHAQTAHPAPDAAAVAFFDDGRKLMSEGKFKEAIAKFEESLRHARTVGALLNLGRCYEEAGRFASAWATYRSAAALARELHDTREIAADRFAVGVQPKVSTLTLDARAIDPIAGAQVKRDGIVVGAAARASATPVDPGEHVVEVSAPGKTTWIGRVQVSGAGAGETLRIPALDDAPVATIVETAPPRSAPPPPSSSAAKTIGVAAVIAGGAGLGLGAIGGLIAMDKHHQTTTLCPTYPNHCANAAEATSENRAAITWATVSTIGFVAGGALAATGIVLLLVGPHDAAHAESGGAAGTSSARDRAIRLAPLVGLQSGGLELRGAW